MAEAAAPVAAAATAGTGKTWVVTGDGLTKAAAAVGATSFKATTAETAQHPRYTFFFLIQFLGFDVYMHLIHASCHHGARHNIFSQN